MSYLEHDIMKSENGNCFYTLEENSNVCDKPIFFFPSFKAKHLQFLTHVFSWNHFYFWLYVKCEKFLSQKMA